MFRRIELPSSSGSSSPITRRQLFISRHDVTSQKTRTFISTAVRTPVSKEEVPAVKEKRWEHQNRKRKIFHRPEWRLVLVVLLLMRSTLMIRLNWNKFVTPLGAHSSKTRSTNQLPRFILLLLEVYVEFALVLCTELI